jgi:hypothetical protein
LSFISFPDKKNQAQFAKLGIGFQNLTATIGNTVFTSQNFYNAYVLGEYRNRTRNNVWDMEAVGNLYFAGVNAGDYTAVISLRRQLGTKLGFLTLGFQNVNRTPSAIFSGPTFFPIQAHATFGKENTTKLFGMYENTQLGLKLGGEYFLLSNYTYADSFYHVNQQAAIFNVLHLSGEKVFRITKHLNWYAELHVQQTAGDAPVHLPLILMRNRLAIEGNYYPNFWLSTGIEMRYYSNYKADNYSPFSGMFFYQNEYTASNRPDINLFFHARIKGFKLFVRLENVNTLNLKDGFSFNRYNFTVPQYPYQGLWFRLGVWWGFVN